MGVYLPVCVCVAGGRGGQVVVVEISLRLGKLGLRLGEKRFGVASR